MKIISYKDKTFQDDLAPLFERTAYPEEIETYVAAILKDIKKRGNPAIAKFAKKFDKVTLTPAKFKVSLREINAASKKVSSKNKKAIKTAIKNISEYAEKQIPTPWSFTPRPGVVVGERFEPLDRVGVYIPGGTAPLVSTVVHTAAIAKTAGVQEIVAVTPPDSKGKILPELLFAMEQAGVTEIYRLGGIYGIAAMAYGTQTIKKVEKIVGPGNAYVTAAKKLVYGEVSLDMVAGPSEIMIIADAKSNPEHIAADLLSQAEHGSGHEQAVLLCTSSRIIKAVNKALIKQAELLTRSKTIDTVMKNGIFLIQVRNIDHAADIATKYAPEHLEIICKRPGSIAKKVKAAGAIFLGKWTPEAAGDFVAGPSHVLPTGGTARYFSGLTAEQFFRRMSIVNYQEQAIKREEETIARFAEMEGLDAHGRSASIRLEK
jgi:histidinol dehydrogenase